MSRFTVIPATTTLADLAAIQANWDKADADMTTESTARSAADNAESTTRAAADLAHINSLIAHLATAIVFNSGSSGISATDVNAALIWINARINTLILGDGTSSAEVVDGRTFETGYTPNRTITLLGDVLRDMQSRLNVLNSQTAHPTHGLSAITTTQASDTIVTMYGRTLVNILGKDGNCESLTGWTNGGTTPIVLSTTQHNSGTSSFKFASAATSSYVFRDYTYPLDATKQYIIAVWVYLESWSSGSVNVISLRDVGTSLTRYNGTVDTSIIGSRQIVYIKVPTSNTLVGTGFRIYLGSTSTPTVTGYIDDIRIYEISSADSTAIGTTYTTDAAIDAFIPYVDGVKHVDYPAITKYGKNLLPDFTQWTLDSHATVTAPYSLTLVATSGGQRTIYTVPTIIGQSYTLTMTLVGDSNIRMKAFDGIGVGGSQIISNASGTTTITALSGFTTITCEAQAAGTFTFTNPQLELGSAATAFTERNDDYLYGITDSLGNPLKLGSDANRTVFDSVRVENGVATLTRRIKLDVPLPGSLSWAFHADNTGFKRFRVDSLLVGTYTNGNGYASKYDGKPLKLMGISDTWDIDKFQIGSANSSIYISASDTDTGSDNAYIMSASEISGFTYGWRINGYTTGTTATDEASGSVTAAGTYALTHAGKYKSVTITKSSDNVTFTAATEGTDYTINYNLTNALLTNSTAGALYYKTTYTYGVVANSWVSVVDGTTAPGTNTIAFVSANQAVGYTPYSLSYQLAATPPPEIVTVEGSIGLQSGGNQIEVLEGVIDREPITPYLSSSVYYINTQNSAAYLTKRASKILAVYKGADLDMAWTKVVTGTANGLGIASLPAASIDLTKQYYVSYVEQDKYLYTGNLVSVDVSYQSNPSMTINSLVKKAADDETSISVLQATAARKNQSPWIAPTMLNAWVNFGGTDAAAGYMKDEFGFTNVKGRIKSGTVGSTAFTLPVGYRPKETQRFTVSSNALFGEVLVNSDGTIVPTVGSNTSFNVQIRFRAEQ